MPEVPLLFRPVESLSNEDVFGRLLLSFFCDSVGFKTYMLLLPMISPVAPEFADCFSFILFKT